MAGAIRHPGLIKGRHVVVHAQGGLDQVHGQHRPGALAQAQVQVQQGGLPQEAPGHLLAYFHGGMRGDHVLFGKWLECRSYQGASRGNKTIDEHGETVTGAAENEAGNAPNLQATNRGEPAKGLVDVRGVELHGAFDHVDFVLPGRFVNTSTIASDLLDRCASKQRHQGTAGCGIANPHVTCRHQRDPVTDALLRHLDANFQALLGLSATHGWLTCHVGRPRADLAGEQTG